MKNNHVYSNDSLKWNIYKFGIVVDLTISQWGARAKLRPEDLGMADVPELIKLGHKDLMKKEHLASINSWISKATTYLYAHSFSFPFGNSRFVPYTLVEETVKFMSKCKEEFENAVLEMLKDYETNRQEILNEYREIFKDILNK